MRFFSGICSQSSYCFPASARADPIEVDPGLFGFTNRTFRGRNRYTTATSSCRAFEFSYLQGRRQIREQARDKTVFAKNLVNVHGDLVLVFLAANICGIVRIFRPPGTSWTGSRAGWWREPSFSLLGFKPRLDLLSLAVKRRAILRRRLRDCVFVTVVRYYKAPACD